MQPFLHHLVWILVIAMLASVAPAAEHRTTFTLKADGSSTVRVDKTEARAMAEQQARMWERIRKQNLGEADDKPAAKQEVKPLTDEELAGKIREAFATQGEQQGEDNAAQLELVDVKSNTVRTVTVQKSESLEHMLRQAYTVWAQSGLNFENLKFEKDENGHLRVTFVPSANARRSEKNLRQQWKLTGTRLETRLAFPGPILSSGFPNTQGHETWIVTDAQQPETLDATARLLEGPTVVTAELAGLKLDRPLESRTLMRSRHSPVGAPDLPITDAGPGFLVEPLSVTTTTVYLFPGGEKNAPDLPSRPLGRTGTVVRAKFYAPKARTLQSVSAVRVLKATDNKGRVVPAAGAREGSDGVDSVVYPAGAGARPGNSTQISFQLDLPQPDAQSIDELSGEAIALTVGRWRELTLTNLTQGATNEVDLAAILPGTRLAITKFTRKNHQLQVQARLTGPAEIRQIELMGKSPNRRGNTATAGEFSFVAREGQSTRALQLNQYEGADADTNQAPVFIVRFPEDQRRERVRFAVLGLDLF
jgi:hypothetical protein